MPLHFSSMSDTPNMLVTATGPIPVFELMDTFSATDGDDLAGQIVDGIRQIRPEFIHPNFIS